MLYVNECNRKCHFKDYREAKQDYEKEKGEEGGLKCYIG